MIVTLCFNSLVIRLMLSNLKHLIPTPVCTRFKGKHICFSLYLQRMNKKEFIIEAATDLIKGKMPKIDNTFYILFENIFFSTSKSCNKNSLIGDGKQESGPIVFIVSIK